jgi:CheY-like chemotaxis protein
VLIMEDEADCLATMVAIVSIEGCVVRTARDGEAAVALAQQFLPHVILLDLALPVIDGYEAAARIRMQPGPAPHDHCGCQRCTLTRSNPGARHAIAR